MSVYQVTCDGVLIYDPRLPKYRLRSLSLKRELNKADSLSFFVYPQHPNITTLSRLKGTLQVTQGGSIISRLRLLDDELGWENGKECIAEGELAFLHDSIQRPFVFPVDPDHATPADLFEFLILRHNAQVSAERQFVVGICTVTDPNNYIARSDTEYSTTWELLNEQLIKTHGGYLWVRHENGQNIIDYLADFSVRANQPIRAGLNLLGIKTKRKGADLATAILPLGAEDDETGERLTIIDIADRDTDDICKSGDIVYSKIAEQQYGSRITKVVKWDDVTVDSNLLTKAVTELGVVRQLPSTVTLTAADLSAAGYDYNSFSLGTYVDIYDDWHADAHGLLARYLVRKLSIDLLDPSKNKLTLGATTLSMTEATAQQIQTAAQTVEANVTKETAKTVREVEIRNQSAIQQSEESVMITVSEQTYTKGEVDDLIGAVTTSIETTADGLEIKFSRLESDLSDATAGADAKFAALQSYIRAQNGTVTFGQVGSEITLTVEHDRIGIYANGVPITYWTAADFVAPMKLQIPVGGRLILGNFAFIPRSSGALDFSWIGG